MSKKQNRSYPEEFKQQALAMYATGDRSASEIERELGITQGLLSRWHRKERQQADGAGVKATSQSLEEQIRQLQRENAQLREDKAILKKAVSIFSQRKR